MDASAGKSQADSDSDSDALLRRVDGSVVKLDGRLWMNEVDAVDADVLTRANGPVLDLGCGPGRHAEALALRGEEVIGIDFSPQAVAIARNKGLAIFERSIFDAIPDRGQWQCALLLDGNIGIGADPGGLLRHVADALLPGGSMLIEVQSDRISDQNEVVRLEISGQPGPWFGWANVDSALIKSLANDIGLNVEESWQNGGRCFVHLTTPTDDL